MKGDTLGSFLQKAIIDKNVIKRRRAKLVVQISSLSYFPVFVVILSKLCALIKKIIKVA